MADESGAEKKEPTSTELMLSLSQIQQLIPLLDYKPGGLAHLVPKLLLPLVPITSTSTADPLAVSMGLSGLTQAAQQDAVKKYRDHVQHASRVAAELVLRLQDPASPAGSAIHLAQQLINQQQVSSATTEKERILRVRKKRRILLEQNKVLQSSWPQPNPAQSVSSPHTAPDPATKPAPQPAAAAPTTPQNVQLYLQYLHVHLPETVPPSTVALVKSTKIRLVAMSNDPAALHTFTLEMHVQPVLKAVLECTWAAEQDSLALAAVRIVGYSENIMATPTTQSAYPVLRAMSAEILRQATTRSEDSLDDTDSWQTYAQLTQTIVQILSAAAQFQ